MNEKKFSKKMMDTYILRAAKNSDINNIRDIYNYYVNNGYEAYSENDVDVGFFINMKKAALSFYILEIKGEPVGFSVLRNYLPYENFRHTGIITYFIKPEFTNMGYGSILYNKLIEDAKKFGINTIIVHLSSLNHRSLKFHTKYGFKECGRFRNIAKKFKQDFDIIWMQKII
jgi:phosphinothricin acetyltransferase